MHNSPNMVITSPERDLRSVCVFMFQCELIVVCHDQLNDQLVTLVFKVK